MSSSLLNAHIACGEPCGDSADLATMADWAGDLIMNGVWVEDMQSGKLLEVATRALYEISNDIKIAYNAAERAKEALDTIEAMRRRTMTR